MGKAVGSLRTPRESQSSAGKPIQDELTRIAKTYGFKIDFYRGEGIEGGTGGEGKTLRINLNAIKGKTDFYMKGVEITKANNHVFQLPTSKAILFHEIGHRMFSNDSTLGYSVMNVIKKLKASGEYGHPTAYAVMTNEFEAMMEFYSFFKLAPTRLKRSQPKMYKLMKRWEHEYFKNIA